MSFGFDPEVPAGYQDADIEMAEMRQAALEAESERRIKLGEAEKEVARLRTDPMFDMCFSKARSIQVEESDIEGNGIWFKANTNGGFFVTSAMLRFMAQYLDAREKCRMLVEQGA